MRLTLRTLLAWLDDTLPPSQVWEIGKQVSESPYAQDLVERIHRVCRQRRLTVASKSGPDWTDPNTVAGYVDNDLDPDHVTEYEKKCLSSDVNLAEVACVHQILSLLGQKVHVPAEAKARMAQLVKGRESIPDPRPDGVKSAPPAQVTKPIQPWVAPEPLPRPWWERFGPALACLGLIGLLSWSAYLSLSPATEPLTTAITPNLTPVIKEAAPAPNPLAESARPAPAPVAEAAKAQTEGSPAAGGVASDPTVRADTDVSGSDNSKDAAEGSGQVAKATRTIPDGADGVVDRADGVLLRFNGESREWERLADGTALSNGDQLICLPPFQSRIVIGTTTLRLLGETRLRILSKTPEESCAFDLLFGRIVLDPPFVKGPVRVDYSGQSLFIERRSEQPVGIEHVATWSFGKHVETPASLKIHHAGGEVILTLGQAKKSLTEQGTILTDTSGKFGEVLSGKVPEWATMTGPSEKDQKLGETFVKLFSRDGHVLADIVAASGDAESPVTKKYAIMSVKALGELSYLTPILAHGKDALTRQTAATALREFLAQGPEALKRLREPLADEFGEGSAQTIETLLAGLSPEESAKQETIERLVEWASPREQTLAIRELALENLKTITGKAVPDYDPENPEDRSFAGWKNLLNKGELKPASTRKTDN